MQFGQFWGTAFGHEFEIIKEISRYLKIRPIYGHLDDYDVESIMFNLAISTRWVLLFSLTSRKMESLLGRNMHHHCVRLEGYDSCTC